MMVFFLSTVLCGSCVRRWWWSVMELRLLRLNEDGEDDVRVVL